MVQLSGRIEIVEDLLDTCDALNRHDPESDVKAGSQPFYCRIFEKFHENLRLLPPQGVSNGFSTSGIVSAIAQMMRGLNESSVSHMIEELEEMLIECFADLRHAREMIDKTLDNCVDEVCISIEVYFKFRLGLLDPLDGDPDYYTGFPGLDTIMTPLRKHIEEAFSGFLENIGLDQDTLVINENGLIVLSTSAFDNDEVMDSCLDGLYKKLARLFSHQSPLLVDDGWEEVELPAVVAEPEPQRIPEHVANHNFEQYREVDWFAAELRLNEGFVDVLRGPQYATLDEVSVPVDVLHAAALTCSICGDTDTAMRELKACQHQMCKDCLVAQLGSRHASRYKCPFCRAYFFPSD
jgi:hypothetical protein